MKKTVAIIGAGPSALILAAFLDSEKFEVTIYEKNKAAGRKFLVAGKGGFNLSHSEPIDSFIKRYTPDNFLTAALLGFSNVDLRNWLKEIGIPTYIGSSKRVYPEKGIKPIKVLQTILKVLEEKNVKMLFEQEWIGWGEANELLFTNGRKIKADYIIFSLGGGSWKVTGSDGSWLDKFSAKGIKTLPFQPANCAYEIDWPATFITKNEGKPLKNLAITCADKTQKGEAVITKFGLEGNAIYALSPQIQKQLSDHKEAIIFLDLKPTLSETTILQKIQLSKGENITDRLRKGLKLNQAQIGLLKIFLSKAEFLDMEMLSAKIKKLPLKVKSAASVEEAISTTGGIDLSEVNKHFELKKLENTFCIGEMLDWNAPTGGYLLQACFSMGVYLARHFNRKLN